MGYTGLRTVDIKAKTRWLIAWFGGREPLVLLVMFAIAAAVWGFIEITDEVIAGDTHAFDKWAVRAVRQADDPALPIGPVWLHEMARDATALGGNAVLTLFILIVAAYFWLDRKFWLMLYLLAATASGLMLSLGLKYLIARPRQEIVPQLATAYTSSFPSGHSFLAAVVYLTLGSLLAAAIRRRRLKVYVIAVAIVLTIVVGLSRLYLGMHYPTDILAGWMAGLAWALLCWLVARWLQSHRHLESEGREIDR